MNQQEITEAPSSTYAKELTLQILQDLAEGKELENVNLRLWDGSYWPDECPRAATVVLNRPSALREMLLPGTEVGLGEAFIHSAFDVEGDLESAFELGDVIIAQTEGWSKKLKMGYLLTRLPQAENNSSQALDRTAHLTGQQHSLKRDREAIRFHYDLSNNFYRLWLDEAMVYSCALFSRKDEDLDAAQIHKLDHICRKLGLKRDDRLLDIGCGWGGLLLHAAQNYGIRGEGITLSEKQAEFARARIVAAGLQDRLSIRIQDYREVKEWDSYDAISSVGMVEHVGRTKLPDYFQQAWRLLKPGGLFLNHGIGLGPIPQPDQSGSFIQQYVFPDTDLRSIGEILGVAEASRFEIRDVESLREHYALTLRIWVTRLEQHHKEALQYVEEPVYRIWRLYMAGCAHGFQIGQLSVYQTLLTKLTSDGTSRAPMTRDPWYRLKS
jgi:cyclopropane-fatty-acyl-phospholipid synthase